MEEEKESKQINIERLGVILSLYESELVGFVEARSLIAREDDSFAEVRDLDLEKAHVQLEAQLRLFDDEDV